MESLNETEVESLKYAIDSEYIHHGLTEVDPYLVDLKVLSATAETIAFELVFTDRNFVSVDAEDPSEFEISVRKNTFKDPVTEKLINDLSVEKMVLPR